MKIIIIGSEGFIGKNLSKHFSSNSLYSVFKSDIVDIQDNHYIRIKRDNEDFQHVFNQKFDICINASGSGSVAFSNTNPLIDYKLNTLNVFFILEAIRILNPGCKFINFSSAAVYGNSIQQPILEDYDLKPVSPYGWHKLMSETICKEFYNQYSIATISLRVFSVYGPGLKKQLFWDIYKKSLGNTVINLEGTGEETRDFIFISDLCEAVEKLILENKFCGNAVNVASGKKTAIKTAAELLLNSLDKNVTVNFSNSYRKGDPKHYLADTSKLKNIDFECKYSINEGLKLYVQWLKVNSL